MHSGLLDMFNESWNTLEHFRLPHAFPEDTGASPEARDVGDPLDLGPVLKIREEKIVRDSTRLVPPSTDPATVSD